MCTLPHCTVKVFSTGVQTGYLTPGSEECVRHRGEDVGDVAAGQVTLQGGEDLLRALLLEAAQHLVTVRAVAVHSLNKPSVNQSTNMNQKVLHPISLLNDS